ncbi:MAG: triacylglycerol lipase [Halomonadaceae bacterium]|nr:MAG: triacylglycerol lipase [Halomonadaceae bacterium]
MINYKKSRLALAAGALTAGLVMAQPAAAFWTDWFGGGEVDNYTETQHPIVLVHGLSGFDELFGFIEYFNGVPSALTDSGAEVLVVQVSASNSTEVRGEQLLAQIEDYMAATGASKVNLIGHSHGSPTARYVAGVAPDKVASVASVGGVNWGTPVADAATGGELDGLGDWFFGLVDYSSGNNDLPQDTNAAVASLSTEGSIAFNQEFPGGVPSSYCADDGASEHNGIRYYSWGGDAVQTNGWDPSDYLLALTATMIDEPNDGLVPACSMKLGEVISVEYEHNHLDQINQVLGLVGRNAADPVDLYRQQANRLQNAGL